MVAYDSEHLCTRCKKRIRKGNEVFIRSLPYGPACARKIRSQQVGRKDFSQPKSIKKLDFGDFKSSGVEEGLFDGSSD